MKKLTIRPLAVLALLAMLGLSAPVIAAAESTTTTSTTTVATTTTTVAGTTTTTVPSSCKDQLRDWIRALAKWHDAHRDIYRHYNNAWWSAVHTFNRALNKAKDPDDLHKALTNLHAALTAAQSDRDAALKALGPAPTQPTC
ncbi:MAG: hypothetical protein ACHQFZ_03245 [Acidimicrobiales bacterium]